MFGYEITVSELEAEIELRKDKNLKTVCQFFKEAVGASSDDMLSEYFSEETATETKAALFVAAGERWKNRNTLSSQRSRINQLCQLAAELLEVATSWRKGDDPQFVRMRDRIRAAIDQKYRSRAAFEKAVFGRHVNLVSHLLTKTYKYPGSHSKKLLERLPKLADSLDLDLEEVRRSLVDISSIGETKVVGVKTFSFGFPQEEWPESLSAAVNVLFQFHMGITPGNDATGKPKHRGKKSRWKIRDSDGVCPSQDNAIALLRSFYGYCVLPDNQSAALDLVRSRLKSASGYWTDQDLSKYVEWMVGEGLKANSACFSWLLDHGLVERWLTWMAKRNDGATKTQAAYCMTLGSWTKPHGAVTQSYEIASIVMGYPELPKRPLTRKEISLIEQRMTDWSDLCDTVSRSFFSLADGFSSDKTAKKRARIRKHDDLMSERDPSEKLELMLSRYLRNEPTHLERSSQSWLLWCRNMTICELLLSNPLRALNICMICPGLRDRGHLYRVRDAFELRFTKHEVKNPDPKKDEGYRAKVSPRASIWLEFYLTEALPYWPVRSDAAERIFRTDSGGPLTGRDLYKILTNISKDFLPEYEPINTHLWRHIIATGWLKRNPNDFVTVALILADTIETVLKEYAHLSVADGVRRYHEDLAARSTSISFTPAMGGGGIK